MKIVIVDNNGSDIKALTEAIAQAVPGSQSLWFTDPLLSAKYICNNQVDIVFMADNMRPVNGFRLLQVLRINVPDIAVVMISESESNQKDASRAGADAYLLKPVSVADVTDIVQKLVLQ